MPLTELSIRRQTAHRLRRFEVHTGEEVRRMRLDAGLSVAALARAVGVDRAYLLRIESGRAHPSNEVLISIGVALGADLSLRFFPGTGPRIHDRFQAPMLETLLRGLHARWRRELEVSITNPSRGVIDAVLSGERSPVVVATEVNSELRRLEQQLRWSAEKADGLAARLTADSETSEAREVSRLLVLRSTTATRELARRFETTMAAVYPCRAADAVAALTTGDAPWPGASIVWMDLHGVTATLMSGPPRGVTLGRVCR